MTSSVPKPNPSGRRNTSPEIPRIKAEKDIQIKKTAAPRFIPNITEFFDEKTTLESLRDFNFQPIEIDTTDTTNRKVNDLYQDIINELKTGYNFVVQNGESPKKQKEIIETIRQFRLNASVLLNYNSEKLNASSLTDRPESVGLNISDIADILFDEKRQSSELSNLPALVRNKSTPNYQEKKRKKIIFCRGKMSLLLIERIIITTYNP